MRRLLLGTVGSLCLIGTALAEPPTNDGTDAAAEASMGAAGKGVIADGQSGFGFGQAAAMNAPDPGGFGNDFSASAVGADVADDASGGISGTASSSGGLGGSASGGVGGTASGGVGGAGSGGVGGGVSGGVGGSASGGVGGAGSGGVGGGASAGASGGGAGGAGGAI